MAETDDLAPPPQGGETSLPDAADARGPDGETRGGTYAQESYSPAARRSELRTTGVEPSPGAVRTTSEIEETAAADYEGVEGELRDSGLPPG